MGFFQLAVKWIVRPAVRDFIVIFLISFSIRVFFLTLVPERHILPHNRWEGQAIATSLVESGQFADPYMIPTGPTAHLPPLVPGVHAFFWSLFGMGMAGGYAAWIFYIMVSSTLYALLPWFGEKVGLGRQAGIIAGIVGSLIVARPGNGETYAALILGLLAVAFLKRWTAGLGSFRRSFILGLACGVSFHLQPVLLPVVLGWMLFELWWSQDYRKWYLATVLVLGMTIACIPWAYRNYTVFNDVFFIRGNLGLELRMGNHEGAAGAIDVMDAQGEFRHPRTHLEDAQLVRELGEVEYMRRVKIEAIDWIKSNPVEFLRLTASRFIQFWLGPIHQPWIALYITVLTLFAILGAWHLRSVMIRPQQAALMIPLIFYPLIYYIVAYMPRYRVPLDWILYLLAGAEVWRWFRKLRKI